MGLRDLITKDVKSENESKTAMVALRVLYLTVLIAFVIDLLIAGSELFKINTVKIFGFLAAIVVLFIGTYYSKTKNLRIHIHKTLNSYLQHLMYRIYL